jgi:glutaredoxin
MRCSGCGKEIPFGGNVCPYCQRAKAGDQQLQIVAIAVALVAGALGSALYGVTGGIVGLLLGALVGGVIAGFLGPSRSKPPQVRISDPQSGAPDAGSSTLTAKLQELDELKNKGLISDEEYTTKRQQLLARL